MNVSAIALLVAILLFLCFWSMRFLHHSGQREGPDVRHFRPIPPRRSNRSGRPMSITAGPAPMAAGSRRPRALTAVLRD